MAASHNRQSCSWPNQALLPIAMLAIPLLGTAGIIFAVYISGNIAHQITDKGNSAYQAGDYPTSLEYHLRAVAVVPQNARYRADLARTHHALAQYSKAISQYTMALDLEPGFPRALCGRAKTYETIGATGLAEQDQNQATAPWSQGKFTETCTPS